MIAEMSGKPIVISNGHPRPKTPQTSQTSQTSQTKTADCILCKLPRFRRICRIIRARLDRDRKEEQVIPEGVKLCQADKFWTEGYKGDGVVVAVVDSGIVDVEDLKDKVVARRNFTSSFLRPNSHGTHVAGTIAADGGIAGVAPDCKLVDVQVLDSTGSGTDQGVADGMLWCKELKEQGLNLQVVNLSLGGPGISENLEAAVKELSAAGIVVVCASGNDGDGKANTDEWNYPASVPACISVAACDLEGKVADFSASNSEVDVTANGVQVLSTIPDGSYESWNGTSMASPHVAGIAALIMQYLNSYELTEVKKRDICLEILYDHFAVDIETPGKDNLSGHGMVVCKPMKEVPLEISA